MSGSSNQLICFNHSHPCFSNETQGEYIGLEGKNHQANYVAVAERLPEDFDMVFTVTNHYEAEGIGFWGELQDEVERKGGEAHLDNQVFRGELDGTRMYGLHGVEAAYQENLDHELLIHGLELDNNEQHAYDNMHDLLEATEDAEVGTLPHPFFLDFDWGEEKREDFFQTASQYDTELSIEYSHGYGLLNHMANGRWFSDQNVADLCEKYEVPAVPGCDWHSSLLKEIALMDYSAVDELEEGNFPLEEFKDMKIVQKTGEKSKTWNQIRDTLGAVSTFGDMIPMLGKAAYNESFQKRVRDLSLSSIEEINSQTLEANAVHLNGGKGLMAEIFS